MVFKEVTRVSNECPNICGNDGTAHLLSFVYVLLVTLKGKEKVY